MESQDIFQEKNEVDENLSKDSEVNEKEEIINTEPLAQEADETSVPETEAAEQPVVAEKYSREQIVARIKTLLEAPIEEIKDEIESLKQQYYKIRKAEIEAAHKLFEETPEDERGDFQIPFDDQEEDLKKLLSDYKEKKSAYIELQEKAREANLTRKRAILDRIKEFLNDTDNIGKYYNEFKELQQEFKEIVEVPATEVSNLWKQFQTYSENFYDLLKIHNELRDYDFKKNLEQKTALCEQAEALAENADILASFKTLQSLHDEWRGIGPVSKELRESIWNRFKEASTVINKRYQQHFESLKETAQANEQAKIALCEELESIDCDGLQSFVEWDEKTKAILDLQERWKTIGFATRKVNTQLFERFRKGCDQFFARKAEYYKSVKENMAANLEKKKALCEQAEALKESTDWRATADKLVKLQQEWRTIGAVPRKYSDAVWKKFTEACDYFFERRKQNFSSKKDEEQANLLAKQAIIEKLNAIDETVDKEEGLAQVRALMAEWAAVGHVPFKEKDKLRKQYQDAVDAHFKRWNVRENHNRMNAFVENVEQLASSDQAQNKLYHERERLVRAYENLKSDLQTYQNNMGFLNVSSKSGNKMVKDLERKIEKLKEDMELLVQKIDLIDEKLR